MTASRGLGRHVARRQTGAAGGQDQGVASAAATSSCSIWTCSSGTTARSTSKPISVQPPGQTIAADVLADACRDAIAHRDDQRAATLPVPIAGHSGFSPGPWSAPRSSPVTFAAI